MQINKKRLCLAWKFTVDCDMHIYLILEVRTTVVVYASRLHMARGREYVISVYKSLS